MNLLHLNLPITARLERGAADASISHAGSETTPASRHLTTAERGAITERLQEIDDECPIETLLETGAAAVCVITLALGLGFDEDRWFVLPVIVSALLLQQVLQGWCPLLPLLRGLGFRMAREIHAERHALELAEHEQAEYHCPFQVRENPVQDPDEPSATEPAPDTSCAGSFSLRQFLLTGAQ